MKYIILILSLAVQFNSYAASNQKCAQVAVRAKFGINENKPIKAENGGVVEADPSQVSYFKNDVGFTEVRTVSGVNVIFEKNGGRIQKVVGGGDIITLDNDCNLEQILLNGSSLEYDRKVCKAIAAQYSAKGMNRDDLFKCAEIEVGVGTAVSKRNKELKEESKNMYLSNSYPNLLRAVECADQFNYENEKDGIVNKSREYLSQTWVLDALCPECASDSEKAAAARQAKKKSQ